MNRATQDEKLTGAKISAMFSVKDVGEIQSVINQHPGYKPDRASFVRVSARHCAAMIKQGRMKIEELFERHGNQQSTAI